MWITHLPEAVVAIVGLRPEVEDESQRVALNTGLSTRKVPADNFQTTHAW